MCEQCLAATTDYQEILPEIYLCRATKNGHTMKSGQWGLVIMNDPFFIFDDTPEPDPMFDWTDDQVDSVSFDVVAQSDQWQEKARRFCDKFLINPEIGHQLLELGKSQGYDRDEDGLFGIWLFHRMGSLLPQNEVF